MKSLQASEIEELNRILTATAELSFQGQGCSVRSVVALCSSVTFGGRPVDHYNMLRLCSSAGLLSMSQGKVALTESGKEFLKLNPESSYELTDAQKHFVVENLILSGPWRSCARDLFLSFSPNYTKITYELSVFDKPLPLRWRSLAHVLRELGAILENGTTLTVAPPYVASVVQLLADRYGTTDEELGQALLAKRRLGAQSEEMVVEYERTRLSVLGRNAEADLVRRISQLDIGAGYDIESFDGDKPLFDYDRFIEVKASQQPQLRFYWTSNERRVAEKLGRQYWIYFIGGLQGSKPDAITPIMIQDPATRLSQISQLRVEVSTYIVTQQSGELSLESVGKEDARGFLL
jgi:hypothetical protein